MVVVVCCCCIPYRLALMLVPTFAPSVLTFAPSTLTFVPCACGVIFLSTSANTPLAHMVVITGWLVLVASTPCTGGGAIQCNLPWWSFSFHPLVHILYLHSSNLHSVVVVVVCGCGGGACSYGMVVVQWQ